ncbi:tesmin [Myotis myotis]|uniref:Testis expressed metallothionein like protein n=1 Tax=Myotis myotis TaxID=51298 RepID=A0A7J7VKY8_MYOMY|nr:tesmin [Myotis myotis]KAF6325832.1 testis expressed metallothionein like protein [Myotis myotis]
MDEAPLLGGMSSPEEEMGPDLFGAEGRFVSENTGLKAPAVVKAEEEEFHVFKDPYLSPAGPKEPLLHAFNPPLGADFGSKVKVELLVDDHEEEILGQFPSLAELDPLEDAVLPAAPPPPPTYNVHLLSSLLTPHRSPALVPLGAWALDGAAHAGVRVIPVEVKEEGGAVPSESVEEAALQNPPSQEPCKFPCSQDAEDSQKDGNTMVLCQLKGGTPVLRTDNPSARELKALHLVPQYQDQNTALQSDVPKPVTTLVGRFLPVPAKLNLITQQLDHGAQPAAALGSALPSGPALPAPPRITLAGYCDCFASGDFCNNCSCDACCSHLRHGLERFKAIKAKIMCSSICKCIGCKHYEESPEQKTLMAVPNYAEAGSFEGSHYVSGLPKFRKERRSSCISWEVVEAACACLLAQGEEAEKGRCSEGLAQQMVLEEFGRCLSQILYIEFKSKGLKME